MSTQRARAEVEAASSLLESDGDKLTVASLDATLVPPPVFQVGGVALLALSALVCLIAMANLMALFLARADARTGELAIRLMNGASRPRIMQMVVVEAILLSGSGGLLGIALAWWVLRMVTEVSWPMRYTSVRYKAAPDPYFVL